jgi:uncharacterized protein YdeI (YjbR/CyaY-like superfamily)
VPAKISPIPTYYPKIRTEWREWLAANYAISTGIWLILIKKGARLAGITYTEAVEEALCFGWIDSRPGTLDAQRFRLYMSPRKPGSVWSKLNKQRIRKLVKDGSMTPAGLAKIEAARKDGSWNKMDEIDRLVIPADLLEKLSANPAAEKPFRKF